MAVKIGMVATFADVKADKTQAVKILEESAEVFSAWENDNGCDGWGYCAKCKSAYNKCYENRLLIDECADVIQAVCNLLAALGVDDLTAVLDRCKQKNIERGREYE